MQSDRRTAILSYCTNVHPMDQSQQYVSLVNMLRDYPAELQKGLANQSFGVGLWLPESALDEIEEQHKIAELKTSLDQFKLHVFTINAFPMKHFHAEHVGQQVYLPDWTQEKRVQYTKRVAQFATQIARAGETISISTVPISYKAFQRSEADIDRAVDALCDVALYCEELSNSSGVDLVICLEPEPLAYLETTAETVDFFVSRLFPALDRAAVEHGTSSQRLRSRIGVCFDTCHVACEWEDLCASIDLYRAQQIRIGKAQLSVALQLNNPKSNPGGLARWLSFHENRYLHQSIGASKSRTAETIAEIEELLRLNSNELESSQKWLEESAIRTHFHVPLFWPGDDEIQTTRHTLEGVVPKLQAAGCQHFEVETYSWNVIPESTRRQLSDNLLEMLRAELKYANKLFAEPVLQFLS